MGNTLRLLRRERGWSQQDLADAAHVGLRTVIRLESDHPGNYKKLSLAQIASAFGWTESQLLNWTPAIPTPDVPQPTRPAPVLTRDDDDERIARDADELWWLRAWRRLPAASRSAMQTVVRMSLGEANHPPSKGSGRKHAS